MVAGGAEKMMDDVFWLMDARCWLVDGFWARCVRDGGSRRMMHVGGGWMWMDGGG